MNHSDLKKLRLDLSLKAKNGIDFIFSATILWFIISYIWTLPFSSYNKSILTFIAGGILLPLAWLMSKLLKINWRIQDNPLQPLGLWFNFAQLFYFPFLIFILIKFPDYFLMTYAIITGAHLFPYAWFYNEIPYAVMAGIISVGVMIIGLIVPVEQMFLIAVYIGAALAILGLLLVLSYQKKQKSETSVHMK